MIGIHRMSKSDGRRSGVGGAHETAPDPELVERSQRRTFTAELEYSPQGDRSPGGGTRSLTEPDMAIRGMGPLSTHPNLPYCHIRVPFEWAICDPAQRSASEYFQHHQMHGVGVHDNGGPTIFLSTCASSQHLASRVDGGADTRGNCGLLPYHMPSLR